MTESLPIRLNYSDQALVCVSSFVFSRGMHAVSLKYAFTCLSLHSTSRASFVTIDGHTLDMLSKSLFCYPVVLVFFHFRLAIALLFGVVTQVVWFSLGVTKLFFSVKHNP